MNLQLREKKTELLDKNLQLLFTFFLFSGGKGLPYFSNHFIKKQTNKEEEKNL